MAYFTVRSVLKSQKELATVPAEQQSSQDSLKHLATEHLAASLTDQTKTVAPPTHYSEGDIKAILASWMGSRPANLNSRVIHFADVDRELKLDQGTTKRYIKEIAVRWRYVVQHEGEHTILFRQLPRED